MNKIFKYAAIAAVLVIGLGSVSAWADGPDKVTLTSISTIPSSTMNGQNVNVGTVNAGATIVLSFTVGVSGSGNTSTVYPDTMNITAPTNIKPDGAPDVSVTGLSNCTLTGRTSTCNESATITAPATPGAYQLRINADDGRVGKDSGKMTGDFFFLNFTVPVSGCSAAATTLVLSEPDCVLYHASSVSLSATLKSGNDPLVEKTVMFYVDGEEVFSALTNSNGVATLIYDPSQLTVGNYALSAEWQSDDACLQNPTVTGAILGVQYLFLGFQPPINADGSTILTGKAGPVKIRIVDANAAPVVDAFPLVFFVDGIQAIVGTDTTNDTVGLNFDYGNIMRYSDGQYVYNWNLSTVTNGTKTVRVFLDEGSCASARQVVVSVGKKK